MQIAEARGEKASQGNKSIAWKYMVRHSQEDRMRTI